MDFFGLPLRFLWGREGNGRVKKQIKTKGALTLVERLTTKSWATPTKKESSSPVLDHRDDAIPTSHTIGSEVTV